ncbi:hypothetical protein HK099_000449 [Clydaea vesicula]|uniref:Rieske domain-containing protein n=1 Tax=Clydaea vesicula TaxID=447962 RepID=A0AAD5U4H7_9FUNG|nr:hypothetical protein HK099_000449 [Clydaea vesicula]
MVRCNIGNLLIDNSTRLVIKLKNSQLEKEIVVAKVNEQLVAYDSICPHSGGPLYRGAIDIEDTLETDDCNAECVVTCPWHEFKFSLKSGKDLTSKLYDMNVYQVILSENTLKFIELNSDWKILSVNKIFVENKKKSAVLDKNAASNGVEIDSSFNKLSLNSSVTEMTLVKFAVKILRTADPLEKVKLTNEASALWKSNSIEIGEHVVPPEKPSRLEDVNIKLDRNRGKGGSVESRIKILHGLANIEQWAVDLAWCIARFSHYKIPSTNLSLPKEFFTDFVQVAEEEAKHFFLLHTRILEMGGIFGTLTYNGGLWESAVETEHSLICSRLSIVNMIHEARGLDVNPQTIAKFAKAQDQESVRILNIIHNDEIGHCAIGQKWFTHITSNLPDNTLPSECFRENSSDLIQLEKKRADRYQIFHSIVRKHFRG